MGNNTLDHIVTDPLDTIQETFRHFLIKKVTAGVLLIIATIIALIIANSPWGQIYRSILSTELIVGTKDVFLCKPLIFWINDGLMAIFFFTIGLEVKREMMYGEISTPRKAMLPVIAALGGMLFPALIYLAINHDPSTARGWGIPTATDIAYSLGILSLLGKRVPISMSVFLATFAIVDDIGAVIIIAVFYSSTILWGTLLLAIGLILTLFTINYLHIRKIYIYIAVGLVIWYLFYKSGIHPTIAGVVVAFTIPTHRRIRMRDFILHFKQYLHEFYGNSRKDAITLTDVQMASIDNMQDQIQRIVSPLQSLEHSLYGFVTLFIVPLFAFANAGVDLSNITGVLSSPFAYSIALSLLLGKLVGIFSFSFIAFRTRLAILPHQFERKHLLGCALLGGIGFTMSLFICNLSFSDPGITNQAKIGVLLGSVIASTMGLVYLKLVTRGNL